MEAELTLYITDELVLYTVQQSLYSHTKDPPPLTVFTSSFLTCRDFIQCTLDWKLHRGLY